MFEVDVPKGIQRQLGNPRKWSTLVEGRRDDRRGAAIGAYHGCSQGCPANGSQRRTKEQY